MYRLRTADKGKPLIISNEIIGEYSVGHVDTLHKKNLFALGEDRYLTTLMTKHFPSMSFKFVPSAMALTAAPESWGVLLSQRRRWINSTIHNLSELVFIHDMCGFCCFSMRFVVFIDLFGTLILPATCGYLAYLLYRVATHTGQFPLISIIMLAAVYGLQAVIFIIKRQWQHIGWMIIYILAFPIYSFVLPVYSFWKQDDFSWGSTRVVIGEAGGKKTVFTANLEDEKFDPRSIPLQRWDDYAAANGLPSRRGLQYEKDGAAGYDYDIDDTQSQYSYARAPSTILTGLNQGHMAPPHSPAPFAGMQTRQSTYSNLGGVYANDRVSGMNQSNNPFNNRPSMAFTPVGASSEHLMSPSHMSYGGSTPNLLGGQNRVRSPLGFDGQASRPGSTLNFMDGPKQGPDDADIARAVQQCLGEVDLDNINRKQMIYLVEQRIGTQLRGKKREVLNRCIDEGLEQIEIEHEEPTHPNAGI